MDVPVIYKIVINDELAYVGSTIDFQQRRLNHLSLLRTNKHTCKALQLLFNGLINPSIEFIILETVKHRSIIKKEQYYLDTLSPSCNKNEKIRRSIPYNYNRRETKAERERFIRIMKSINKYEQSKTID